MAKYRVTYFSNETRGSSEAIVVQASNENLARAKAHDLLDGTQWFPAQAVVTSVRKVTR
jgi:hypothetical protein